MKTRRQRTGRKILRQTLKAKETASPRKAARETRQTAATNRETPFEQKLEVLASAPIGLQAARKTEHASANMHLAATRGT